MDTGKHDIELPTLRAYFNNSIDIWGKGGKKLSQKIQSYLWGKENQNVIRFSITVFYTEIHRDSVFIIFYTFKKHMWVNDFF